MVTARPLISCTFVSLNKNKAFFAPSLPSIWDLTCPFRKLKALHLSAVGFLGVFYVLVLGFTLEGNLVFHKSVHNLSIQLLKGIVGGGKQGKVSRLTQLLNQTGFSSCSLEKKSSISNIWSVVWFGLVHEVPSS